jgi:hypothetical protein
VRVVTVREGDPDRQARRIGGVSVYAFMRNVEPRSVAVEQLPTPCRREFALRMRVLIV